MSSVEADIIMRQGNIGASRKAANGEKKESRANYRNGQK
jgi:hypothetical protein